MKKIYLVLFITGISLPALSEVLEEGSTPEIAIQEEMYEPKAEPQNLVIPMGYEEAGGVSAPNAVIPLGEEHHQPKAVSAVEKHSPNAITTADQINNMPDGASVVMVGEIVIHKTGTDYVFEDHTGTVNVKIDTQTWGDLRAYDVDQLKIMGYIDKNYIDGPKVIVTKVEDQY